MKLGNFKFESPLYSWLAAVKNEVWACLVAQSNLQIWQVTSPTGGPVFQVPCPQMQGSSKPKSAQLPNGFHPNTTGRVYHWYPYPEYQRFPDILANTRQSRVKLNHIRESWIACVQPWDIQDTIFGLSSFKIYLGYKILQPLISKFISNLIFKVPGIWAAYDIRLTNITSQIISDASALNLG